MQSQLRIQIDLHQLEDFLKWRVYASRIAIEDRQKFNHLVHSSDLRHLMTYVCKSYEIQGRRMLT